MVTETENNQAESTQDPAVVVMDQLCHELCKHERKEKKNNKIIERLQCSHCGKWFHFDCINLKKSEYHGVWPCDSCCLVPNHVIQMKQTIDLMMSTLQNSILTSDKALESITKKCDTLEKDNKELKSQIEKLTKLFQNSQPCVCAADQNPSLVIGDLLLKDVDENKLQNSTVTSLPDGKTSDILQKLRNTTNSYQHIYICAGTNDCSAVDFNGENITKTYKDIVTTAKEKVSNPSNITISSIPPRSDDTVAQEHIEIINANLSAIATENGVHFVNQDDTFKLRDGTPNDGYLVADGPKLSVKGTNKLCANLKIPVKSKTSRNVCRTNNSKHAERNSFKTNDNPPDNDSQTWQVVQRRRQRPSKRNDTYQQSSSSRCWNCYENNHVSRNCRFSSPIRCHTCGILGHKSKFCSYSSD